MYNPPTTLEFDPISEKEFEDTGCTPSYYPGDYYSTGRINCNWGMEYEFVIVDGDNEGKENFLIVDVYGPAVGHAWAEIPYDGSFAGTIALANELWKDLLAGDALNNPKEAKDFEWNQLDDIFRAYGTELQYNS